MSVDFHIVCEQCLAHIHAGQTMAGLRFTSGFGSHDESGQEEVGEFLSRHDHGGPLKLMKTESVPNGYEDQGSP